MEKVEEYIDEHTMMCSNELDSHPRYEYGIEIKEYEPWLTPEHARSAAAIAREETAEAFARIIRGNLSMIDESVQVKFEQLYIDITGEKMFKGFKD